MAFLMRLSGLGNDMSKRIMAALSTVQKAGYSIVPVSLYFKGSRIKMEIALAKGKKLHDKRDSAAERDAKRDIDRALKERSKY